MNEVINSLRISANGRGLEHPDGRPFFYLGDTAWELFHRLSTEDAEYYLQNRAAKGFTVIQAVVLAELHGLHVPSAGGHLPLLDADPTRPNESYFANVDSLVTKASELGLFVGMLPTWGDLWHGGPDGSKAIFNENNAFEYGQFLGRRYKDQPIIWILGGDRMVENERHRRIIAAMAQGLRAGDGGRHLITFHPIGQFSSAIWFHDEPWLDFNMLQTGHTRDRDNYNSVAADFGRTPVKPIIDGEPGYENIPHAFDIVHGRLDAHQARKFCYWALFSGAFGHTYGCNDVWQMWKSGDQSHIWADTSWRSALDFPGAEQMGHARTLIESGPYWNRLPDQSLIASPNPSGADHIQACRAANGDYALIYFPTGYGASIRTYLLRSSRLSVTWFNPRTGELQAGEDIVEPWRANTFTPPGSLPPGLGDWVLILTKQADA